jgi:hypothetical protein
LNLSLLLVIFRNWFLFRRLFCWGIIFVWAVTATLVIVDIRSYDVLIATAGIDAFVDAELSIFQFVTQCSHFCQASAKQDRASAEISHPSYFSVV